MVGGEGKGRGGGVKGHHWTIVELEQAGLLSQELTSAWSAQTLHIARAVASCLGVSPEQTVKSTGSWLRWHAALSETGCTNGRPTQRKERVYDTAAYSARV